MKKPRPNITLQNGAEIRQSGILLTFLKGICELRRKKGAPRSKRPLPQGVFPKKLSFILCTTGKCPVLPEALASTLSQTLPKEDYEVLLVLNGPTPPPDGVIPDGVRCVQEPTLGLSYARNTGAKHAEGQLLLYIDDDAVASPKLAAEMVKAAARHPRAAIIGGQIFLELPSPRPAEVLLGKEGLWSEYRVPYRRYRTVREQYAFPYGACFAVRHEALTEMGGFPTAYGRVGENYAGGEETALCFLALRFGWEIGIQPSAWVRHRVENRRFCKEHIQKTLRAGILTTYQLFCDGYAPRGWDLAYVKERLRIARLELVRLEKNGEEWPLFYKKCEADAFAELLSIIEKGDACEKAL